MPITSVGDMSQHFQQLRQNGDLKTRLNTLSEEMSSGRMADLTKHLDGDLTKLSGLDHDLALLGTYRQITRETSQMLTQMQTSLERISSARGALAGTLLLVDQSSYAGQIDEAALFGRSSFEDMVRTMNTTVGGRSLFAGVAVDGPALGAADDMLASMVTAIGAGVSSGDVLTAIDTWFDNPVGGFATMGYLGDTGTTVTRRIGLDQSIEIDLRADDPAMRDMLRATAISAVVDEMGGVLSHEVKGALLQEAGVQLVEVAQTFTQVRSRLGFVEATVEEAATRQTAQTTAYSIMRNNLAAADPYETASRLQDVQLQLETHYTLTARLSQMSLLEYIR